MIGTLSLWPGRGRMTLREPILSQFYLCGFASLREIFFLRFLCLVAAILNLLFGSSCKILFVSIRGPYSCPFAVDLSSVFACIRVDTLSIVSI